MTTRIFLPMKWDEQDIFMCVAQEKRSMNKLPRIRCGLLLCVVLSAFLPAQQTQMKLQRMVMNDDDAYSPAIKKPAYEKDGPVVLLDKGHRNFSGQHGTLRLLSADGYQAKESTGHFTFDALRQAAVLVVAGPGIMMSRKDIEDPQPLFTEEEAATLHDWVAGGGALLLATSGQDISVLLRRFEVELSQGQVRDAKLFSPKSEKQYHDYTLNAGNEGLSQDGILNGRSTEENVKSVVLDSLVKAIAKAPENARPLLRCSESAMSYMPDVLQASELKAATATAIAAGKPPAETTTSTAPAPRTTPAPHIPLAIAFAYGKGRVVVVTNSMIFTALTRSEVINDKKAEAGRQTGLTEADNQQFALNVMHWLSGLIE
jgi:hypothetical protein